MGISRNLYPRGTSTSPTSYTPNTGSSEIDLRAEFDGFVFGDGGEMPHGRKYLLRKMRKDSSGSRIECACRDSLTHEPDTERSCPFCLGEGYLWNETWITGRDMYVGADGGNANRFRRFTPGDVRADHRIFYFRYDTDISYYDRIIDIKLDMDGEPVVPYERESIYRPQTIKRYRSDNGRTEYIAVYCREEDAIREDD